MYNNNTSLGLLSRLPLEIIQSVFFTLVAQRPLGTPSALVPLFVTSRDVHAIATSSALLARVFRLKFDTGAIARRHFQPTHDDLKEQLVHACTLLRKLRSGDVFEKQADQSLFSALVLLFENDGKNYAQLEWAGVKEFAEEFMKQRMWEDALHTNDGWPLENTGNASALWVLWLTLTKDKLQSETLREREDFILYVLPYVLLTFRYAASQAPPNHFHFPLTDPIADRLSFPIPSNAPTPPRYPIYNRYTLSQPHFRARIDLRPPLASIAAKLLYVSRREVRKIAVPPHLPLVPGPNTVGLTQADYHELNKGKAAPLPRGARWNWSGGYAEGVNYPDEGDETKAEKEDPPGLRIVQGDEESRRWDPTWWKMRLCQWVKEGRPRFVPGDVYAPGSMRGLWKGRFYVPTGETYRHLLHTPQYPGATDERGLFSEAGVYILMQPFHLELEEHHRICGCSSSSPASSSSTSTTSCSACGVIPTPPPVIQEFTTDPESDEEHEPEPDFEAEAAQAAASAAAEMAVTAAAQAEETARSEFVPPRNMDWNDPHAGNLARERGEVDAHEQDQAQALALAGSSSSPSSSRDADAGENDNNNDTNNAHDEQNDGEGDDPQVMIYNDMRIPRRIHVAVDYGMRNAWFPGRMGGVTFTKRRVVEGLFEREARMRGSWERSRLGIQQSEDEKQHMDEQDDSGSDVERSPRGSRTRKNGKDKELRRREETVFSISGFMPDTSMDGRCLSLAGDDASGSSQTESQGQGQAPSWVYETHDPARVGTHDLHLHRGPSSSSSSFPACSSPPSSSSSSAFPSSSFSPLPPTANPSCAHCVALARARLAEKRKKEEKERKAMLDRELRAFEPERSSSVFPRPAPMDLDANNDGNDEDGHKHEDVEMVDLDMSGFGLVDSDEEDDDEEEGEGEEGEMAVLGDDLPHGQPGFWTSPERLESPCPPELGSSHPTPSDPSSSTPSSSSTAPSTTPSTNPTPNPTPKNKKKRTYIPPTRREFDRARITTSSPCSGIQDVALTGSTPAQHALWYTGGRGYVFYGRVRPWDGLVGIMRVGVSGARRGQDGNGQAQNADGNGEDQGGEEDEMMMDTTFIFGYLVGETTFVGEWRVAGADPLRPAWSGPVVFSRR